MFRLLFLMCLLITSTLPRLASADDFELCNRTSVSPDVGIPACTRLLSREGESANAPGFLNNRGIGKVRSGDFTGAIQDFSSALDRNPRFVDAFLNRGIARQLSGDLDRAISDFNQAIRIQPDSAALYNARGAVLSNKDEHDRAIVDFDTAIAKDRNFVKAYVNRGVAQMYRRRLKRAVADFDEVVRLLPNDPIGYINRAAVQIDQGNIDGAIEDYSHAIRLDPKRSGSLSRRGEAWRLKGDLDRSFEDHNAAIEIDRTAEAFNNRALAWKDRGNLDKAIEDCTESILIDGAYFLAFANRGDLWRLKGDAKRALTDLNKAVSLNPKSPVSLVYRGDIFRDQGDAKRSLADYNEAIKNVPDFVAAFTSRGLAYEKFGDIPKAKLDFQRAVALTSEADGSLARPARELAGKRILAIEEAESAKLASAMEAARKKVDLAAEKKLDAENAAKAAAVQRAQSEVKALEEARAKERVDQLIREATAKADAQVKAKEAQFAVSLAEAEAKAGANAEAKARLEVERRVKEELQARLDVQAKEAQTKLAAESNRITMERGVRVALIIGNSVYQHVPHLPNPRRDAEAVAATFTKLGFQTVLAAKDLSRTQFLAKLREFEDQAAAADWAVIYYAGHGLEMDGSNFLLPIDARLQSDRDIQDESITLDRMLQATERAKKLRLVVLDSCRDNPFLNRMRRTVASRSIGRGLARIEPEGGTLVAFAAREGQIARDGTGDNSPFTSAFLRNVVKPNLEINMLFRRVRDEVFEETQRSQEPFVYGSLPGTNFYFAVN